MEHDTRLRAAAFQRLQSYIEEVQEEVKFHSHVFSSDGLKTNPEKVRGIVCFTSFPFFVNSVKVTCTPAVFVGIKGVPVQAY